MKDPAKQLRKIRYYAANMLKLAIPASYFRHRLRSKLEQVPTGSSEEIQRRVSYYNKINREFDLAGYGVPAGSLRPGKQNSYYFDLRNVLRYFDPDNLVAYLFGDITLVPEVPTVVKSRPIGEGNENAVLMKLNQVRHFRFVEDRIPFHQKRNAVVWRGSCRRKQARRELVAKHFGTPNCDIGDSDPLRQGQQGHRGYLSIWDQLQYKFVLSVEGNDVATNLKWIMSSNSLCFMAKPKYETWFMEGTLIPDFHYVLLKDDYSDLEERIEYFINHNDKALSIIRNAHSFVTQFRDESKEEIISLMVMDRYFKFSRQS